MMQVTTKVFPKKTRRGQVVLLVREHYLRDDVACGCECCVLPSCIPPPDLSLLSRDADHYLIPDTIFTLKYLEILESSEIKDVIFLRTVVNEVREPRNLPVQRAYQRVKNIVKLPTRRCIVFNNENFSQTYLPRIKTESFKDRYDRVIVRAAQYYTSHLADYKKKIIIVTSDESLKALAEKSGVTAMLPEPYLKQYYPNSFNLHELYDSLTQMWAEKEREKEMEKEREKEREKDGGSATTDVTTKQSTIYRPYIGEEMMEVGVKSGRYYAGTLQVNNHNTEEAYVRLGTLSTEFFGGSRRDILVATKKQANRAVQGDRVVVELLQDRDLWKKPFDVLPVEEDEEDSAERSTKMTGVGSGIPTGQVVGVLQRNWRDYVTTMQVEGESGKEYVLMVPLDRRIPKIRIKTRQAALFDQSRVVCRIDSWEADSNYPLGHYVRKLGDIGDLETEISAILVEHDITITPFSQAILQSLPPFTSATEGFKVPPAELKYRRDLRKVTRVFSIDPLGSQDIDDALSVHEENGNLVVGVHIADVSHYVKPGTPLDVEARVRSTTVYLPDRRYDMLPAVLSEDLCSLRGGQDRFAMSVLWTFDPKTLDVIDTWYGRTVIHSNGELHYQLAQDIMDGPLNAESAKHLKERAKDGVTLEEIRHDLLLLLKIFRELRDRRMSRGALELEGTEVRFVLTPGSKNPEKILTKQELEVNKMVAEFMIFANKSVAEKIYSVFPSSGLLRRHALPKLANFDTLIKCATAQGFTIDTSSNAALAKSLSLAVNPSDPHVNRLLRMLTTQAMTEAEYFSTGSFEYSEFYHYGLALDAYTHFTSPIRRYADIIVHRQLWACLNKAPLPPMEHPELAEVSEHINKKHRNSKHAQMHATELFQALYFQHPSNQGTHASAIIYSFRANGLMVFIPKYGLRGSVYLRDKEGKLLIPPNAFSTNPGEYTSSIVATEYRLSGESCLVLDTNKGPVEINLFDHVTVKITVEESRSHLPPIKMQLVHFGSEEKSSTSSKSTKAVDEQKNKDPATTMVNAKAMATEIKLEQERKKAIAQKIPIDEYEAYKQPTGVDDSMYALLEQLELLSLDSEVSERPQTKEEDNVVKLWALNQKTLALREKMHEKTKKYWQSQYEDAYYGEEDSGGFSSSSSPSPSSSSSSSSRNKESAMDRYKGELTKLERSMKAVQHQRYNARR